MPIGIKPRKLLTAIAVTALTIAPNLAFFPSASLAQRQQETWEQYSTNRPSSIPSLGLNTQTDFYFGLIHLEMQGRAIQPHQTQYQKEWLAIRDVLKDRLVWTQLLCVDESYGYHLTDYSETITAISDAVFYVRHPKLGGRQIQPHETEFIREWKSISENFPPSLC
ncbi:MAG: hypothetical protein F6K31_15760 [Symploca sp. SIO2G7]|nr:hypothetical protein [Symploca sp. SIO2G7]